MRRERRHEVGRDRHLFLVRVRGVVVALGWKTECGGVDGVAGLEGGAGAGAFRGASGGEAFDEAFDGGFPEADLFFVPTAKGEILEVVVALPPDIERIGT